MLKSAVRSVLAIAVAMGLLCVDTPSNAQTAHDTSPATYGGTPTKKKNKVKVKVGAQKGVAKGVMSIFGRRSGSGMTDPSGSGAGKSSRKVSTHDRDKVVQACMLLGDPSLCMGADDTPSATSSLMLTRPLAQAMAVTLVTELPLPEPRPLFGPDPSVNEWNMLTVGFPIWLRTEGATTVSTSASASGLTFRMTARWRSTTFHTGDGNAVTCTSMANYSATVKPGTPSPDCGHVYTKPSLPKGKYTVRAVADWDVSWSVAGFSGVIPAYNDASAAIPIGELVALNR